MSRLDKLKQIREQGSTPALEPVSVPAPANDRLQRLREVRQMSNSTSAPMSTIPEQPVAPKRPFQERVAFGGALFSSGAMSTVGSTLGAVETLLKGTLSTIRKQPEVAEGSLIDKANIFAKEPRQNAITKQIDKFIQSPNYFEETLKGQADKTMRGVMELQGRDLTYWQNVTTAGGSTLPFFVGGMLGGSKAIDSTKLNLAMSGTEAMINAYEDYKELVETDKSRPVQKAVASFGANLGLNYLTNKLGFLSGVGKAQKVTVPLVIKKFLATTLLETNQEVMQDFISGIATGKSPDVMLKNMAQTGLVSLPISGVFGIGSVAMIKPEIKERQTKEFLTGVAKEGATRNDVIEGVAIATGGDKQQIQREIQSFIENNEDIKLAFEENEVAQLRQLTEGLMPEDTGAQREEAMFKKEVADTTASEESLISEAKKYKSAEEFVNKIETRVANDKTYGGLYERYQDNFNLTKKATPTSVPDESAKGFTMANFSGIDIKLKDFEINYPFADRAKILKNKETGEILFYLKPETKLEKLPKKLINLMEYSDKPYNKKAYFITKDGGKTWNTLETSMLDSAEMQKLTKSQLEEIWNKANRGEKFQTKKKTKGKKGFVSSQEALEKAMDIPVFKELQARGQVVLSEKLNNPKTLASYYKGVIKFINNPHETTLPHESFHAFADLVLTTDEKATALDLVRETGMGDLQAEEKLAQDFAEWYVGKKKKTALEKIFDKIKAFFNKLIGNKNEIESLFESVLDEKLVRSINSFEKLGGIEALRAEYNQSPEEFTYELFEKSDIWKKPSLKKATIIGALGSLRKPLMKEFVSTKLDTDFAGQDVIDTEELRRSIYSDLLEMKIIETNKYADYGLSNIGTTTNSAKTYILNTNFLHGRTGHFSGDFETTITKDDLEIRVIPAGIHQGQRVEKDQYYVTTKNLSAANLLEGTFGKFDTRDEAQAYIDGFSDMTQEKPGLFGHFRAFKDSISNDDTGEAFNVVEMQSDVFQDLGPSYFRSNSRLMKNELEIVQSDINSLKATIQNLKDTKSRQEAQIKEKEEEIKKLDKKESGYKLLLQGKQDGIDAFLERIKETDEDIAKKQDYVDRQKKELEKIRAKYTEQAEGSYFGKQEIYQRITENINNLQTTVDNAFDERNNGMNLRFVESAIRDLHTYKMIARKDLILRLFDTTNNEADRVDINLSDFNDQYIQALTLKNTAYGDKNRKGIVKALELRIAEAKRNLPSKEEFLKLTPQEEREVKLSEQFISFKNNYYETIINSAIRQAAMEDARVIRFATPYTVANVEGYIVAEEYGDPESSYTEEEIRNIGVGGSIETFGGYDGIITSINYAGYEVAYADKDLSSAYSEYDIIDSEKQDRFSEFNYNEDLDYVKDKLREYIENYPNLSVKPLGKELEQELLKTIDEAKDIESLENIPGFETVKEEIIEEYMDNFDAYEYMRGSYGSDGFASYEDRGTTYYVDAGGNDVSTETLAYKTSFSGSAEEFKISDIPNEEHQAIAAKYGTDDSGKDGAFLKYIKRKRKDLNEVIDENGFSWYESTITPEDKASVELYQTEDQVTKSDKRSDAQASIIANKNKIQDLERLEDPTLVSAEIGVEKIKSYQERLGVSFPVNVYNKIFTGEMQDGNPVTAFGMYLDGEITLAKTITALTADHEMVHLAFRNIKQIPVFKGLSQEQIFEDLKKKYNDKEYTKMELEEKLAEDFEVYAKERETKKTTSFTGKIKSFFDKLYKALKDLVSISSSEYASIDKFYYQLFFGTNSKVVSLENTSGTSAFMKERAEQFGELQPLFKVSRSDIKKEFTKGFRTGVVTQKGKSQFVVNKIKRDNELKSLRESITKRLYTEQTLDALRQNLPKREWGRFMTRLSKIGMSEAKFTDLLSDIFEKSSELKIAEGQRKDEAKARAYIGFLKHIYDVEPSLVLSIKRDLDIRDTYKTGERVGQLKDSLKSIKDYSMIELGAFIEELKKRIEFRKNNPVKYLAYAEVKEKPSIAKTIKSADKNFIATIERKIQKISKSLYEGLMSVFFEINKRNTDTTAKVEAVVEMYNKASLEDQALIAEYAYSGKIENLKKVLYEYATVEEVDTAIESIRETLDLIHRDLKEVGVDVGYRANYFPRVMKALTTEKADIMLNNFENKMGRKATVEERTLIINNLLRGIDSARLPFITLSGKKFETQRLIENVTPDLLPFYEDFVTSLRSYIIGANTTIETRKFFGKSVIDGLNYDANMENSIGAKVLELKDSGIIKGDQIEEVRDTLNTLFNYKLEKHAKAVQQFTNDYLYPLTLGQITSTIFQLADLSMQTLLNDVLVGQFNTIGGIKIKPEDVYLSDSIQELESAVKSGEGAIAKLGQKVMTPFGKADNFFLTVFINSAYRRMVKTAKDPKQSKKLLAELTEIFGEVKAGEVMTDLVSSTGKETGAELSNEVRRYIFGEIAKTRPITKLQKTRGSIRNPAWYTLKNFQMKQLQFVRSQAIDVIAEGVREKDAKKVAQGIGKLTVIMTYIAFLTAGVDELRDWVSGNPYGDFSDALLDGFIQVFGLNKYMLDTAKTSRGGLPERLAWSYSPAVLTIMTQVINDSARDIKDVIEGESLLDTRSVRRLPWVGNIIYYRAGRGS